MYKRIPVKFWKEAGDETGGPKLLVLKDFNGDGAEELFIADADSDTSTPIVYSWSKDKNGLMMLYYGKHEFWQ